MSRPGNCAAEPLALVPVADPGPTRGALALAAVVSARVTLSAATAVTGAAPSCTGRAVAVATPSTRAIAAVPIPAAPSATILGVRNSGIGGPRGCAPIG